jgi:hypothetical protein
MAKPTVHACIVDCSRARNQLIVNVGSARGACASRLSRRPRSCEASGNHNFLPSASVMALIAESSEVRKRNARNDGYLLGRKSQKPKKATQVLRCDWTPDVKRAADAIALTARIHAGERAKIVGVRRMGAKSSVFPAASSGHNWYDTCAQARKSMTPIDAQTSIVLHNREDFVQTESRGPRGSAMSLANPHLADGPQTTGPCGETVQRYNRRGGILPLTDASRSLIDVIDRWYANSPGVRHQR